MKKPVVTLDVRKEIAQGRPPCGLIMQNAATLPPGGQLRVIAPFQPTPLLEKLANQGFGHRARELANGDWEVTFAREFTENQVIP